LIDITPFKKEHLQDAAKLVSKRYIDLQKQIPLLPAKYKKESAFIPLLHNILDADNPGVAALQNGSLVGFLTGWRLPSFRGERSIYSPEWGNGADLSGSKQIYEEMYSKLAKIWVEEKFSAHYISLFPNDSDALKSWHWMGFGMISVDAIRGLDPILDSKPDIKVRKAEVDDLQQVMDLHQELRIYMKESPIFLPRNEQSQSYFRDWLQDPNKVVWLGLKDNEPAAFMRLGPADEDVCTIILDKGTTSIYAAYTKESYRFEGAGAAVLEQSLFSARSSGYKRCAVTFEPMNLIGTRFWLKYFTPVCYSLLRHIDVRLFLPDGDEI